MIEQSNLSHLIKVVLYHSSMTSLFPTEGEGYKVFCCVRNTTRQTMEREAVSCEVITNAINYISVWIETSYSFLTSVSMKTTLPPQ